ncbi:hypothetical protein FB451DRAFT_1221319 [Mycena latifolia]|nr:hypothetical protein FB451DRAFT_1221319 [Mycena latifolia]
MEVDTEPANVWFEDGTLIIDTGNVLHRVSRSILAARSSVFKDMFSLPQPPDAETLQGCPVVRLQDSPDDILVFLRAIFDAEFFMPYPAPTTFNAVAGILRLSNKYEVPYLRRRALVHLSSVYPTKLSDLDVSTQTDAPAWKRRSWKTSVSIHVTAIVLAREVNAPWIIPYAFYRLGNVSEAKIIQKALCSTLPEGWSATLTSCDILRFLYYPSTAIEGCTSREACTSARLRAFTYLKEPLAQLTDPLFIWEPEDWAEFKICSACSTSLKQTHQEARQAFWDKLPEMYGMPGWEELEKFKEEAIGDDLFQ